MAQADLPVVVRIPFSHFCRKAEWGLTQAGIPYECWDMLPAARLRMESFTRQGRVPVLIQQGRLLEGSDRILAWADRHRVEGALPLYPDGIADEVRRWEDWAGEVLGPLSRREAYRVAYNDPAHFGERMSWHLAARLGHNQILGVLKYLKARRFDEADVQALPQVTERISSRLHETGTGYLFTDDPTAADIATAALFLPLLSAAPGRDYEDLPGWHRCLEFVETLEPPAVLRRRRHWMNRRRWAALEAAARRGMEEGGEQAGRLRR